MSNQPSQIVQKLWSYCNVLRDDLSACVHAQAGGMSYLLARCPQAGGDYPSAKLRTGPSTELRAGVEQLTAICYRPFKGAF